MSPLPASAELDILAVLWSLGPSTVREVHEERTQQQLAGDLLTRAFAGSARELMLGAVSAKPASKEELSEIRRMIEVFEKGKR